MRWFAILPLAACGIDETGLLPPDAAPADVTTQDAPFVDATQDVAPADVADEPIAPDASDAADASNPVIALVQNRTTSGAGTNLSTTIASTSPGDLVVVLSVYIDVNASITSVTDGMNTYVSANVRSTVGACQAAEIWYARDVKAGATSVKTSMSESCQIGVWVLEVSGANASGGVDVGMIGSGPATTTITVPAVTPSSVPAFVAAAVGSCGTLGALVNGNPFTALAQQFLNGGAFYVATAPGTYGPVFKNSNDGWNASIAAFR